MYQIGVLAFHYRSLRSACLTGAGFDDRHATIFTQAFGVAVTIWTSISRSVLSKTAASWDILNIVCCGFLQFFQSHARLGHD